MIIINFIAVIIVGVVVPVMVLVAVGIIVVAVVCTILLRYTKIKQENNGRGSIETDVSQ